VSGRGSPYGRPQETLGLGILIVYATYACPATTSGCPAGPGGPGLSLERISPERGAL
jgi:hypothetical protein